MVSRKSLIAARVAALLVASALVFAACGGDDDEPSSTGDGGGGSGGQTVDITTADFAFDPTTIEAEAGEEITVMLTNEDDTEHSFTIDDPEVETEAEGGDSSEVTFTAPDSSVEFYCKYHPDQMTGEVSVGGSAAGDTGSNSGDSGGAGVYDTGN